MGETKETRNDILALLAAAIAPSVIGGLSFTIAGCGAVAEDPEAYKLNEDTEVVGEELFVKGSRIWRSLSIPVCWENPTASNLADRTLVKDAIAATWSTSTRVKFTGWSSNPCAAGAKGIRIRIADQRPEAVVGRDIDGDVNGMTLNFDYVNFNPDCSLTETVRKDCVKGYAIHEFGHALGFDHEQLRSDTPAWCTDGIGDPVDGDTLQGPWDANSIMNYCNPVLNNGGVLSTGDIKGARQYYGDPSATTSKRDAVNWGNGKIYFFNKTEYTRYDVANDRSDSGYPKPISGNWSGWPATWTNGVDAVVNWGNGKAYFFNGGNVARFDIATDQFDVSPKTLAQTFANWPTTWTAIDAGVRWNNGKAYLFRGTEYIRVVLATLSVDQQPKTISGNWPGLFTSGINYAFEKGTKGYFFSGLNYDRYDMALDKVDAGYPLPIVGYWPGFNF